MPAFKEAKNINDIDREDSKSISKYPGPNENSCDPILDESESIEQDEFLRKFFEGIDSIKSKTDFLNLSLKESVEEVKKQNERFTIWENKCGKLKSLFITDNKDTRYTLTAFDKIYTRPVKHGTRFKFWQCDDNDKRDFLLFDYEIGKKLVAGTTQDLTDQESIGINYRVIPSTNLYIVVIRYNSPEIVRREVKECLQSDYEEFLEQNHRTFPLMKAFCSAVSDKISDERSKLQEVCLSFVRNWGLQTGIAALTIIFIIVFVFNFNPDLAFKKSKLSEVPVEVSTSRQNQLPPTEPVENYEQINFRQGEGMAGLPENNKSQQTQPDLRHMKADKPPVEKTEPVGEVNSFERQTYVANNSVNNCFSKMANGHNVLKTQEATDPTLTKAEPEKQIASAQEKNLTKFSVCDENSFWEPLNFDFENFGEESEPAEPFDLNNNKQNDVFNSGASGNESIK